jgi:hypothetical protein
MSFVQRRTAWRRTSAGGIGTSLAASVVAAFLALPCAAQELEPRRWSHLPVGINFFGSGYARTGADVAFDPVLRLENVEMEMDSVPFKYIRTFELFERSARVDVLQIYQVARWSGLVDGVPTTTSRNGWSDLSLRFAVNLWGAPPLSGEEFAKYRADIDSETIVGLGLVVQFPTGHYLEDRLLNLGSNRFTFRPQLGAVHNWGKWSTEVTLASWIFTDNDRFFNGNRLAQDPMYTIQGHVVYTFRPGLWATAGLGYGIGAESTLNGIRKDDQRENIGWQLGLGYPITPKVGVKLDYIGFRTQTSIGANSDTLAAGLSVLY